LSGLTGGVDAQTLIAAPDERAQPQWWRLAPDDYDRGEDGLWPRSRFGGAGGYIESTWYQQPELASGWGVSGLPFLYTLTPTVGGTAPSRPVYTLTLPATDYTIQQVYVVNATVAPTKRLTITRAFLPGDVISIDCDSYEVTVNGAAVDFSGTFPLLDPRAGSTNAINFYALAADTPTLTPAIAWTPRYLS